MLDKNLVVKLAQQYAAEVEKFLSPQAIVLYGSYVKGCATQDSDIDIAVVLSEFSGDYLETSKQLYKLRRNISADIEPILLVSSCDDSGFVHEILTTGLLVG